MKTAGMFDPLKTRWHSSKGSMPPDTWNITNCTSPTDMPTERDDYFAEREPGRWPPGWWAAAGLIVALILAGVVVTCVAI
jgi:hypothetical protein